MLKFLAGKKLREPISVPRLQVVQKTKTENGDVNTETMWNFTTTLRENSLFGVNLEAGSFDDFHMMQVKEQFESYVQMAEFKLFRAHILIKNVTGNENNTAPIQSFLRLASNYKEKFVMTNGPYDQIREATQRRGLIIILSEIFRNLQEWNRPSAADNLWDVTRMLICCNVIKELQEKVFNMINRKVAIHELQLQLYNAIYDAMDLHQFSTDIGEEIKIRDSIAEYSIESIPSEENDTGGGFFGNRDFLYCIFYAEFQMNYSIKQRQNKVFTLNVTMKEMEDPDLDEEHFYMLENDAIEGKRIDNQHYKLLLPNKISLNADPVLPAIEFYNKIQL